VAVRQFRELYDLILPYVPAVELPLVDYHIRRVTREFTRRTTLWRMRVEITTAAGVNDYVIAPYDAAEAPAGEEATPEVCDPYSIISVVLDGRAIPPRPEEARAPYGARPSNAKPNSWYSPSARVLHLYPTPDAAYTVTVDVVCALTMFPANPVLPEFLFVDYREIIADGVVASLKSLANKPWYDPEGAMLWSRRYANATQGIRAKLRDANQPNRSVMRGPRFGA